MSKLIDYYRNWPTPITDDYDLYWRIFNTSRFDWEKEWVYMPYGGMCQRPHKGQHFTPDEYDDALVELYEANAPYDQRFTQTMGGFWLHEAIPGDTSCTQTG